jgi:ABC-type sugar transport system substrate-binding protein
LKNFTASAARRLRVFLIGGGGSKIFKIFTVSAAAALFFQKKAAAVAAQPIGLHLYSQHNYFFSSVTNTI